MPPLDQLLASGLIAAVFGLIGVVVGAVITAVTEIKREEKRAEREREARQEEYVRRRRDEFEKILVDFVPIQKQWRSLQELAIREVHAEVVDANPMLDREALEAAEKQMDIYIGQVQVRSPSDRLTEILGNVVGYRGTIRQNANYVNRVGLERDKGEPQEAKDGLYEALAEFGDEVEVLVKGNSADVRGAEVA